ncbi:MAG: hypothetical protein WCA49_18670 [Candidatus Sulfotelmatobacter sp.]
MPALKWTADTGLDTSLVKITPEDTSEGSGTATLFLSLEIAKDKKARGKLETDIQTDLTKAQIRVTAKSTSSDDSSSDKKAAQSAMATVEITTKGAGNIIIPIIGFEQAGASAAQSSQKFFFNLFVNRPLPFGDEQITKDGVNLGTRYRWFGNVRIATYPQQITSGVAEFAAGFATQVAQLKVNQLAQSGEFNMGLDLRLTAAPWGLYSLGGSTKEYTSLSFIAGFGAISPLNPVDTLQIFVTPPVGSPQRSTFLNQFPGSANSTYTGFVSSDRDRFYWEYGAGFRLTTQYFDRSNVLGVTTPAMLSYTLGQSQIVSGGVSSGIVQRIEAFLPLPLGDTFTKDSSTFYLFGRVDMRLAPPHQIQPFILQPAPAGVNGYDSDVNIVTVRSNRDLYTIGVGVDAIGLVKTISGQNKTKTKNAPAAKKK